MNYYISDDKRRLPLGELWALLRQTYWARERDMETVARSVESSLCFGAYAAESGELIGFARVITDYATTFYLCDVTVAEAYRGQGVGKALAERAVNDARVRSLRGILATGDAHGLYERFGFELNSQKFMERKAGKDDNNG